MKKNILLIFMTLLTANTFSQSLVVTQEGFRDESNLDNNYVVLEFENKDAEDLYNSAVKYISLNYKNPDEVISGQVENDFIKYNTYVSNFPEAKSAWVNLDLNTKYTTLLSFKDNKVKYEIVSINMENIDGIRLAFTGSAWDGNHTIYNKKGKLKKEDAKTQLESYFNNDIQSVLSALNGESSSEDDW